MSLKPDPEAQPRPDLYQPPDPRHVRPHPKGKPSSEEIEAYVREMERRLGITKPEEKP